MSDSVKWELWRRHRRDGQPDVMLDSGASVDAMQAARAIRLAEMKFPIGYVSDMNYVIIDGEKREEGGWTPNRWSEGGWGG